MHVSIEVSDQRISDLLCSALEGGSNYWYSIEDNFKPLGCKYLSDAPMAGGWLVITASDGAHSVPDGERINLDDFDMVPAFIDRAACERGLRIMQENHPRHFANVLDESDDAETGDVFLQCCCFGELIFG